MKKVLFLTTCLMLCMSINAQDIMTMQDGSIIETKVTEIAEDEISYKKWSNIDGPIYKIRKSDVKSITYKDGSKDEFVSESTSILDQKKWNSSVGLNVTIQPVFTLDYILRYKFSQLYSLGAGVGVGYHAGASYYSFFSRSSVSSSHGLVTLIVSNKFSFHLHNINKFVPYVDIQCGPQMDFDSSEIQASGRLETGIELPISKHILEFGIQCSAICDFSLGFHAGYKF